VVTTPVIVDGAATLLVLQKLLGSHADLLGDTDDDRAGTSCVCCGKRASSWKLCTFHLWMKGTLTVTR